MLRNKGRSLLSPSTSKGTATGFSQSHDLLVPRSYILGNKVTYADLVPHEICHDENLMQDGRQSLKDYLILAKLVDAVEDQPKAKKFSMSNTLYVS